MSGFNYLINLNVIGGNSLDRAIAATERFENSLDKAQVEVNETGRSIKRLGVDGQRSFDGMQSSVGRWVAGLGIAVATMGSLQTAAQNEGLEKSIEFAGGVAGAKNLEFVRSEVERLGLPLKESLEGFKTLSGSMMNSGITAEQQRDIFQGLGEGIATFRLPAEQANRAMLALGQMASKGTVSAEELKGQLGEALPGASGIAAKALGVTESQMQKMLEKGDILAKDFLPKFAAEMHKTFAGSAVDATNSATANFNRMNTAVYDLKVAVGEQLMPTVIGLIQDYLIPAAHWIGENIEILGGLVTVFGSLYVAAKLYTLSAGIMALATGGFTGSVWGLNAALLGNPITWVVGGLVALGAAVVYAWNKFEGFRGFMTGMWEVIKELGTLFWERVILPFMSFGKIIAGIFTFDTDMIASGLTDAVKVGESFATSAGARIGNAYTTGRDEALGINQGSFFDTTFGRDAYENSRDDRQGALGSANFGAGGAGGKNGKSAKEISDSITGGGQRNVTINVGKLNDGGITINTTNMKEGVQDIEAMLMKMLLQVVNSGNQVQPN